MVDTIEALQELIRQRGVAGAVRACRRPPVPSRLLREIHGEYREDSLLLEFLARYPLIPSDLAEQMAETLAEEQPAVALGLAANPRTPPAALQHLAEAGSEAVLVEMAGNARLGQREIGFLAQAEAAAVRAEVARHAMLSTSWQRILARDEAEAVRLAVAERKGLEFELAVALGNDESVAVRKALLNNPALDEEIRQMHADCDHLESQRILLASKRALPETVLRSLCLSPHGEIRRGACSRVELSGAELLFLGESEDPDDRLFLAGKDHLPVAIQRLLLSDPSESVRCRLAGNPVIDPEIAARIASSEDIAAAGTLAVNTAVDAEVVLALCHHSSDTVAEAVTLREDLGPEHLDVLFHRPSLAAAELLAFAGVAYREIQPATAERLAASRYPSVRALAAGSFHLPATAFWQLGKDRSPAVVLAIAHNPAAPRQLLYELSGSEDRVLAFAAEDSMRSSKEPIQQPTTL